MNKDQTLEILYVKVCWALIIMGCFYVFFSHALDGNLFGASFIIGMALLAAVSIFNALKYFLIKKLEYKKYYFFPLFRLFETCIIVLSIEVLGLGEWSWVMVMFPIAAATLVKGRKSGIEVAEYSFLIFILAFILKDYSGMWKNNTYYLVHFTDLQHLFYFYFITGAFTVLCFSVYKYYMNSGNDKEKQIEQFKEKCRQLADVCETAKQKCCALENEKNELVERNSELLGSAAEYFTLQQVTQTISSVLDIKELLKDVNDIIIGVMGVSHSTVIFYDEKKKRLKVSITSVVERSELATLMDNMNSPVLLEAMENDKGIIENNVDAVKYSFTKGRDIKSLICAPINTKSRKFGLVVAEQKFYNAFNENNARILNIIGQQIGFAMENAELYQKMQELATIDGLTGVYNRHYFHDRLQKEFKSASEGNYDLSLLIFDIDHFKRFNDTYGHLFGDKVLKSIVDLLKGCIRSTDVFARFGGEEFIILFPRTKLREAYEKAEMLRDKVSKSVIKDELVFVSVTASFGVSSFPENASSENELIRFADDALYGAKESGRNCVVTAGTKG